MAAASPGTGPQQPKNRVLQQHAYVSLIIAAAPCTRISCYHPCWMYVMLILSCFHLNALISYMVPQPLLLIPWPLLFPMIVVKHLQRYGSGEGLTLLP